MPEYDMPLEEQIKVLVKEFRNFKESMETFQESMDTFKESVDTRFDSIDSKLTTVDTKVTTLDAKVTSLDTKLTTLDTKVDKMQVLLDDTRAIAKLGREGLQGLRESTDARFEAATKTHGEQTGLLNSVLVHVRNRVDRVERPAAKGRRR
jgi:predicted RNase H-like nuclease (RuvC/YqgF family)